MAEDNSALASPSSGADIAEYDSFSSNALASWVLDVRVAIWEPRIVCAASHRTKPSVSVEAR